MMLSDIYYIIYSCSKYINTTLYVGVEYKELDVGDKAQFTFNYSCMV